MEHLPCNPDSGVPQGVSSSVRLPPQLRSTECHPYCSLHSLAGSPFPPPWVPDGLQKNLCRPKILLHGLFKLLLHPLLSLRHGSGPSSLSYTATASRVLWNNIFHKASFFSWTASMTTGVHHRVLGLPPLEAPRP